MDSIIITGASKGLGAAMVEQLLPTGCRIFAVSRSTNQELIDRSKESPSLLSWIQADLSDPGQAPGLIEGIARDIDTEGARRLVLINNAGTVRPYGVMGAIDPEEARRGIDLNVTAPVILTNSFVAAFRDAPGKKVVINISSGASFRAMPGLGVYSATKAALNLVTHAAAKELSDSAAGSWWFFAVTPGKIDTPMQQSMREEGSGVLPDHQTYVEWKTTGELVDPRESSAQILTLLDREDVENGSFVKSQDLA